MTAPAGIAAEPPDYPPRLAFASVITMDELKELAAAADSYEKGVSPQDDFLDCRDPYAVAWAKLHAAEYLRHDGPGCKLDEAARSEIRAALTKAVADKLTHRQIAELMERDYGYSRTRAKLIAHTEVGLATTRGSYARAVLTGMKVKKWLLSNDPGVCFACRENAAQSWIPIFQPFASGVQAPSEHAGCRCDAVYFLEIPSWTRAP